MNDFKRLFRTFRGQRFQPAALIGAALVVGLLGTGAFVAVAQQATPGAYLTQAESQTFPAAIYNGSCASLGDVAFPLSPVGLPEGSTTVGQSAVPAYQSVTGLETVSLTDLLGGPFAIAVGAEEQGGEPAVVCGDVGGTQSGGTLLLGLQPVGDSGYAGVALLAQEPSTTNLNVVIYLTATRAGVATPVAASPAANATPAATTPAATTQPAGTPATGGGQAQNQVTITLNDIYFNPNLITIPANTNVTVVLENKGAANHNFSITDHNNPNVKNLNISVDVASGQSQQTTINAPAGTYYFYCDVPGHEQAGMFGYLVVQDGAAIATQEATVTPPAGS